MITSVKTTMICNQCGGEYEPQEYGDNYCSACHVELSKVSMWRSYRRAVCSLPPKFRLIADSCGAKTRAKNMIDGSYYLTGQPGAGKTVLATMIAKQNWRRGRGARFISYPRLIFGIQTDYENNVHRIDEVMKFKDLLILDDFGAEKMTDFVRQTSYLIIDYREQYKLQTIITSNFSLNEIDTHIDRRISSRICGMCEVINMEGDKRVTK